MVDADNYDVSQIESNLAAYYTIDDKLYSMPFNSSTPIMYYNKDMFAQAGITEVPDSLEGISKIGDQLMNQGGASEVMSLGIYGWFLNSLLESKDWIMQTMEMDVTTSQQPLILIKTELQKYFDRMADP